MELHKFLESTYVSANNELQQTYSVYKHAKTAGTKDLMDAYRAVCKFMSYFDIAGHFILVKLHILSAPQTAEQMFQAASQSVPVKEATVTSIVPDQSEPTEHHADGVK